MSMVCFWHIPMWEVSSPVMYGAGYVSIARRSQYVCLAGALTATLVELFNPPFLDDNMTIPIASSAAIHFALIRCGRPLLPLIE